MTIDVHAHVFNGSDLQVREFFDRVWLVEQPEFKILRPLVPALQDAMWAFAPDKDKELQALRRIGAAAKACGRDEVQSIYEADRDSAHSQGVGQINQAIAAAKSRSRSEQDQRDLDLIAQAMSQVSPEYKEYVLLPAAIAGPSGVDLLGAIDFILRGFQYRYVNTFDYLREYTTGTERNIDLMICHIVDYDWPLAGGHPTKTPLSDQVAIMEQLSIVTQGRVHAYVPFDPMRQVAWDLHADTFSALQFVIDAVTNHGCIGVKLYPPMGFAPFGNKSKSADLWRGPKHPWIPPILQRDDIGERLDSALGRLYDWCLTNGVPIMAHTDTSNAPAPDYIQFTDPGGWKDIGHPGLRFSFGHFGETNETQDLSLQRPLQFAGLMTAESGSLGERYYADVGYFNDVLDNADVLIKDFRYLLNRTSAKNGASLANRLMYGTDWEMIVQRGRITSQYLIQFEKVFNQLDGEPDFGAKRLLSDRFFGLNAVDYLGLKVRGGANTRDRLDAFYSARRVPTPCWASKVDLLGAP